MDRSARFVAFAVAAALAVAAWRVGGSGQRLVPVDRVPVVDDGATVQVGGALADFDLMGDRMVLALGSRVVVGQLGARDQWSIVASSTPIQDGVRVVDAIDDRWAAVLRGRSVCAVDVLADGPIAWDRCHALPLPALHALCDGGWCALELADGAVAVLGAREGAWQPTDVVVRPAFGYSGFALAGDVLAVVEADDRVCGHALPSGQRLGCGVRPGVTGLFGLGGQLASYAAGTLAFDDAASLATGPLTTRTLNGPIDALAGGHGALALQQGGSLSVFEGHPGPSGGPSEADAESAGERSADAAMGVATFAFDGRLGAVAAAGARACWSRSVGRDDRAFGAIRCVERPSGQATLSLIVPGVVEHALQLDGRLALVDASAGVGLVDVAAGTIDLLADGALMSQAHGLAVDDRAVAVAMGRDGFGLLARPVRRLDAGSLSWRNADARNVIGIGIDADRVIAADGDGSLIVADRRTGNTTQRFETGGYPLEVLPTAAGVFVGNRDRGLMLMRRGAGGSYACCQTVLHGAVSDVALAGDRMAIARGDDGISVASPEQAAAGRAAITSATTAGPALGVAWSGRRLVVAEADGYVEWFDAPDGGPLAPLGRRWVGGIPERVWHDGSGLVVASERGGVTLVPDDAPLDAAIAGAPVPDVALYAPDALAEAIAAGEVIVVDVRRTDEFAESHIPGARSVPITDLPRFVAEQDLGTTTVVPYCLKDFRGYEAIRLLQQSGVPRVGAIDGFGLAAWKAANLPLAGTLAGQDDATALDALGQWMDDR